MSQISNEVVPGTNKICLRRYLSRVDRSDFAPHWALSTFAMDRPCGVGVPGPPGYGDIGGGGAIGLMMSDGSRGFPFTRMKPPGAAAAVKPLAEGIILQEGLRSVDLWIRKCVKTALFLLRFPSPSTRLSRGTFKSLPKILHQ